MTEPIDHAAEAREFLARARAGQNNILAELGDDDSELDAEALMLAQEGVSAAASQANAHASLALVAAQDRANELKRIEILASLAQTEQASIAEAMDGPGGARPSILSGQAGAALFDWDGDLKSSIARSLGLGGESDGE